MPAVKWGASSDQSNELAGIKCSRLEEPLPGGLREWFDWRKIAQIIEELP